jgi:uncharacterized protein YdhG (YjbR/CyaY superfamily)
MLTIEDMAETKNSTGFSAAERAAMKQRAKELKAQESAADALKSVLDKIASFDEPDKTNATRIHEIVTKVAPSLMPRLFYGSPGYADADGKIICFYQERAKFKVRYGNFAFFDAAKLDDGTISAADEKKIAEIVKKAAGL